MSSLFPFPPRKRVQSHAERHQRMIYLLSQLAPPSDLPSSNRASSQAAGLRAQARYLRDLQSLVQPVIEHVVARAVDEADCKDVTDMTATPLEALEDNVLSAMEARADEIKEDAQASFWPRERVGG